MSDKPSAQPPSMLFRGISTHSLAQSINVDQLMDEYHDGQLRQSFDFKPEMRSADTPDATPAAPKESGFGRFGRLITSSFNPISAWGNFSRTWKESKDDLTVRNIEENRRKAAQKALAEQKYAELKKAGLLPKPAYTVMSSNVSAQIREDDDDEDETDHPIKEEDVERDIPRDSAVNLQVESTVNIQSESNVNLHVDSVDAAKALPCLPQEQQPRPDSPTVQQQPEKLLKLRKSFFTIRRPSLNNLKRVRSELNLGAFASRQSSSSISPEKQDTADSGTLLKSQSRKDLKVQHKLSKRVSDLETKLADARRDLQNTINGVSPVTLTSRFEKYTPSQRGRIPRFIPGKLQSLPSERLLFPQDQSSQSFTHQGDDVFTPVDTTNSLEHSSAPASTNKNLPAVPEPDHQIDSLELDQNCDQAHEPYFPVTSAHKASTKINPQNDEMDPATLFSAPIQDATTPAEYEDLDTRLKGLDANVKINPAKKSGNKKRKSGSKDDGLYRPGRDEGDDSDFSDAPKSKFKKKRKSAGKAVESSKTKKISKSNNPVAKGKKSAASKPAPPVQAPQPSPPAIRIEAADTNEIIDIPSDDNSNSTSSSDPSPEREHEHHQPRTSLDGQTGPLEPIYEEETTVIASKHDSGISMTSTHSLHVVRNTSRSKTTTTPRFGNRSRSTSPTKTSHAGHGRSTSPQPVMQLLGVGEAVDGAVTVMPGVGSVPEMPMLVGESGVETDAGRKAGWEWPDDVF